MTDDRIAALEQAVAHLTREVDALRRPKPWIPAHATVGDGGKIDPQVRLMCSEENPIRIGTGVRIYRGTELNGPVTIGDRTFINRDAYVRQHTTIGDDVMIGPFVRLITDGHDIGPGSRRAGQNHTRPIVVGHGTWIGAGVTVVGGVTIGSGCVIAAGSVVTRDVPDNTIAGGAPARVIRSMEATLDSGERPVNADARRPPKR